MTQQPQAKYRRDYRAPEYTISDIDLTFSLDAATTIVTAESKVQRHAGPEVALRLDGEDLVLKSIAVDGQPWSHYQQVEGALIIEQLPERFTLTIVNQISPAANTALEGLYQSGDALCTQCESQGFRHITWYLDRPDVLARFTTKIIADASRYPFLLSNGNRVAQGELEDGRHWVQWQDPFPKPSYLFALVAGDFDVLRDTFTTRSGREVALELYVDRGNLDRADWAMTSLKNAMKWDETRFGLEYDLDIYMVVAVDFFNMGAMENKGLNIFNAKYVLARAETATDKDYLNIERVIGHEYFHNWTGNRVTCRDWFQLSLKEGLTVFRDQEFSSDLGSRAVNRISNVRTMRGMQFAEDASPMAHPIRPDMVIEMNNFYTLTVYEKGAEVIRMMHTLLGEENFQKGMQLYFERHDGSAATCDDFVQAMEDASSVDLSQFRRWYSQSGTPVVTVRDDYDPEKEQYCLTLSQRTPATADQAEKLPLHIPFDIELYDNEGKVIPLQKDGHPVHNVLNLTQAEQTFVFDNVWFQPVPSLLREFSAPVKLEYKWSDQQLTFLMRHARNDFSRWDAAQSLLATYIRLSVARYQAGQPLSLPLHVADAFRAILLDEHIDPALAAEILTLPSQNEMAELFQVIDPAAIAAVHNALTRTLARELADELLAVYRANTLSGYRIDHGDIGKRALRNVCLHYLAFVDNGQADALVSRQYHDADNMTDALAALSAAVAADLACSKTLMQEYDDRWHQDGLVMDKWFILQATSGADNVLDTVRALLNHRSFSMGNPNRIRSLIGAFVSGNPAAFHAPDGSGYRFLVEMLTELNTRNPQVASRLIEPLIRLKRYDSKRQALMRDALEALKGLPDLSGDLYEKISKALA
ncbi:aminopeptidase N [Shimwellia blattae]|uniref:Aminopeptidase N n=1 Tax=Shimwellia blattae (strain ATCC 29907 / DSM 4481 / JCM 1650 / NBRC 105725 / CDC 9005-74) TaxID=630626 RepID=I2BAM1_SHIBC|nr:aminopeptidase N [Shimwellia blattae]AFJ47575.1 aminopeptidase N [Shimwellia blattae DSM 4481 = NBRC 105725]GAB79848.1 aminopeptidase N [Shimwellia blattae DSM 4481 = NBRC 105725]VDY65073.1 Aminopeptidase N [Shimwellia blattae]VEC23495.1 Aminopeptidase N [Shimwellia blattae]